MATPTPPAHDALAEQAARLFHEIYEAAAPRYGYATRVESRVPWDDLPENHRALMVVTCAEVLQRLFGRGEPVGVLASELAYAQRIVAATRRDAEALVHRCEKAEHAITVARNAVVARNAPTGEEEGGPCR